MPLQLKQKLRKAFRPGAKSSGPSDREGQFGQAGSLRDVEASRVKEGSRAEPASGTASAPDPLSVGIGRLSLNAESRGQQHGRSVIHGDATAGGSTYTTSSYEKDSAGDRTHSPHGYARSVRISEEDPYSEQVADRNITPPKTWTLDGGAIEGNTAPSKNRTHSEDVDVEATQLPAVTHETRIVNTHEIVEQKITRDIHNCDVYHRVLPVIDVEVLPPRHFVPSKNGDSLVEIPASQVPGGGSDDAAIQRSIKQAYLKERLQPRSAGAS